MLLLWQVEEFSFLVWCFLNRLSHLKTSSTIIFKKYQALKFIPMTTGLSKIPSFVIEKPIACTPCTVQGNVKFGKGYN